MKKKKTAPPFSPPAFDIASASLFARTWSTRQYDIRLRSTMLHILNVFALDGIGAKFNGRGGWLHCHLGKSDEPVMKEVEEYLSTIIGMHPAGVIGNATIGEGSTLLVTCIGDEGNQNQVSDNFAYALFRPKTLGRLNDESHLPRVIESIRQSVLPFIFDAMRQRERRFLPFAPLVSELYWKNSDISLFGSVSSANAGRQCVSFARPPWDEEQPQATATLSVDLRKSTFCMEQADDPIAFGSWLDEFVQILTVICHGNGGVFDKFTGDGAIVHFLDDECRSLFNRSGLMSAFACSVDIHRAVVLHLKRLVEILRFTSERIGAAIGIDWGPVYWSLDHRDNPIAVGRSVVGACRLCGADAGMTQMTNIAFQILAKEYSDIRFIMKPIRFKSKEFNDDEMQISVMAIEVPLYASQFGIGEAGVLRACEEIYERTRVRVKP